MAEALEIGGGIVFAAGVWLYSLWRWPFRSGGRLRFGARTVDRVVRRSAGRHRREGGGDE